MIFGYIWIFLGFVRYCYAEVAILVDVGDCVCMAGWSFGGSVVILARPAGGQGQNTGSLRKDFCQCFPQLFLFF